MSDSPAPLSPTSTTTTTTKKKSRGPLLLLLLVLLVPIAMCVPLCVIGGQSQGSVAAVTVLELDLETPIGETPGTPSILSPTTSMSTRDVVFALEKAAADPKVKGLYARIGGASHGLATGQEVRDAVIAFKKSGKFTLAYSESFGELSPGTGGYYVASAFDEIWLMPTGNVSLSPLAGEGMFARDALAKLGVEPEFAARKEYKNAPNTFSEQSFTEFHKEATLRLLASVQDSLTKDIAAARPAIGDAAAVTTLLASGPFSDSKALELKLVDKLGYREEAIAAIKAKAGEGAALLWLSKYFERAGSPYDDATAATSVAVITAVGQIHRGPSNNDPISGSESVGSDTVCAAIRAAVADDDVKAIVLRIDSPGGSVTASEAIAHEIDRAREKKKPVIATMSNVAGSGGYYIAMNADAIVAQPGTITGSIGVYAGKFVTTKLWEQLGINYETIAVGDKDVSFFSTDQPYSEDAKKKLNVLVDDIYVSFVTKVAKGRQKTFEQIEPVARGRIWSGTDGKERGLVDELGGFPVALRLVREKLGKPVDSKLHLKDFPPRKKPIEELLAMFDGDDGESSEKPGRGGVSSTSKIGVPDARALSRLWAQEPAVLLTPPMQVLR
ncbi:MAG: signal peptide peptidase SppA [Deltaproteobacteria bacterium]|nr:signal peptide peptidase SppA [Deltaproteobacteria bacterium]